MFMKKYGFSDMCTQKVLKKECIFLPVDDNGKPNWTYMEMYMKCAEKKAQSRIASLL